MDPLLHEASGEREYPPLYREIRIPIIPSIDNYISTNLSLTLIQQKPRAKCSAARTESAMYPYWAAEIPYKRHSNIMNHDLLQTLIINRILCSIVRFTLCFTNIHKPARGLSTSHTARIDRMNTSAMVNLRSLQPFRIVSRHMVQEVAYTSGNQVVFFFSIIYPIQNWLRYLSGGWK
jgi:hypothetical protein